MQQLVADLTRPVVLSDRAVRQLTRVRHARSEYTRRHGREPTTRDLSDHCGLARLQVETLLAAEQRPRALDEPVAGDEGVVGTLGDQLPDPRAEEAYDRVPARMEEEHMLLLIDGLSQREQVILNARFGLGGPERTLRDLAGGLGVSTERVRQIEECALAKLRAAVSP
jgi:DNA-directed RNA polymerase sigma subunit (sigma70/sigma32)